MIHKISKTSYNKAGGNKNPQPEVLLPAFLFVKYLLCPAAFHIDTGTAAAASVPAAVLYIDRADGLL